MQQLNKKIILTAVTVFLSFSAFAQKSYQISGSVKDGQDSMPVTGAGVVLVNLTDTLQKTGTTSGADGFFVLNVNQSGKYRLEISFIGYADYKKEIFVNNQNVALRPVYLNSGSEQLNVVNIKVDVNPVQIKGDTVQFNAEAYKVNPDASAEDLIKKMPGVTSEGNTVKVNGEEVKKVLVDGKPFFSDDPTTTLKNVPADMIGSVQVFDQQSDQSLFTGIFDGNEEKTINLTTKKGMNVGKFGKIYTGYGTDNKNSSGFTLNSFNGPQRISLIGMSNNINQQNFNISDILSVMSNSGQSSGRGAMRGSNNFMTGQQNGITNTNAIGLNYNDNWGKRIRVSGNYFFNNTDNNSISSVLRHYYTEDQLQYKQDDVSETKNLNHKANFKFEYFIDSANKITINPSLTLQSNSTNSKLTGETRSGENYISDLLNQTKTSARGFNFNNDILLQHRFSKIGRTISLNLNTQISNNKGDGSYTSVTQYADTSVTGITTDQQYTSDGKNSTIGANLSYTERVGKRAVLLFSYKPTITKSESERLVNNAGSAGQYTELDTVLSNTFKNTYITNRGGFTYNLKLTNSILTIGTDVQHAELSSAQEYPKSLSLDKSFFSVLPSFRYNYKSKKNFNFNASYQANTRSPSISQLQNNIDQSNSLFIKSGNPDLKQATENSFTIRTMKRLPAKSQHFMVFVRATQTANYVGNSTSILQSDTIINNVTLKRGSQFIVPVNVKGYYSLSSFGGFGFPVKIIKSNLNFNAGYTITNTPALINNQLNNALSQSYRFGFYLGSNISQNLDFSLSYNGSYNNVANSLQVQSNSSYLSHTLNARTNYIFLKKFVLNSDITEYLYTGLSSGYNKSYALWNASAGYKFLKNNALETKLVVYDLLNQNKSISRNITETYTEDNQTKVLNRYFMLSVTYTFKKFKNNAVGPQEIEFPKGMPPPGMHRPH
ncbi:MAG: TonB-dependent receptor [Bacteroidetes bacterium]|nr:TonB-dependent receptor [Bacteroidota bacterium]